MTIGKVLLIGAGPGDLELLTLKAARCLGESDVLLVDDLVNPDIVKFAPHAKVIYVGKRGGCQSTPQNFILRLMRRYAKQGKQVARVKGGDPLLFGRAGEEIAFLQKAGIVTEVVNGITSAISAAASIGVSLTHRHMAHGVVFVTAHLQDGSEPNWDALAKTGCTLAIYMGLHRVTEICKKLQLVLPPNTPAAAISSVTTKQEHRLVSTISDLAKDISLQQLPSPTMILIGEAIGMAGNIVQPENIVQAYTLLG